ncbi:MAG: SIS domain-containing protein [Desulfotomaculum sp.]|nr:SIS domain-containing protein [Desulfotomaculum sp.]
MKIQQLRQDMLKELADVFMQIRDEDITNLVDEISHAKRVFIYGLGREKLMLKAFAMRLMHLGIQVYVIGDVTTPAITTGDLFVTSSGTGYLSTVDALMKIVKKENARALFITAHPEAPLPQQADLIIKIPAQTMKDNIDDRASLQPMGSLFEQAQLLLLELAVILIKEKLGVTDEDMEKNHTNLE